MIFDKTWFDENQRKLLWLSNTPVVKRIFRWVMCIEQDKPVLTRILPNATFWDAGNDKTAFDFRTHNKYSKRLYYGFYYIWAFCHLLDMEFINFFIPKWNLGFDAFGPYYPDAGTGVSDIDGHIASRIDEAGASFATVRAGASTYYAEDSDAASYLTIGTDSSGNWRNIRRMFFGFDTSSIGADVTVDSAIISFSSNGKSNVFTTADNAHVCAAGDFGTSITSGDWGLVSDTSFANITHAAWSTSGYNDFTLDSNGRDNVVIDGVSRYALRGERDITNATINGGNSKYCSKTVAMSDTSGTASDPKLTGTFSGGVIQKILTETMSITGVISRITRRTLTDLLDLVDTATLIKVISVVYSEIISTTDTVFKKASKVYSETINTTGTAFKLAKRTLTDLIDIVGTFTKIAIMTKVLTEIISITGTIFKKTSRELTEAINIVSTALKKSGKVLTEAINITGVYSRVLNFFKTLTESIGVSDTILKKVNGVFADIWGKVSKTVSTWTKTARNSSIWTKTPKPE